MQCIGRPQRWIIASGMLRSISESIILSSGPSVSMRAATNMLKGELGSLTRKRSLLTPFTTRWSRGGHRELNRYRPLTASVQSSSAFNICLSTTHPSHVDPSHGTGPSASWTMHVLPSRCRSSVGMVPTQSSTARSPRLLIRHAISLSVSSPLKQIHLPELHEFESTKSLIDFCILPASEFRTNKYRSKSAITCLKALYTSWLRESFVAPKLQIKAPAATRDSAAGNAEGSSTKARFRGFKGCCSFE